MNLIRLFRHEFESMPEYSRSIPTGATIFKMWRRRDYYDEDLAGSPSNCVVGQYVPSEIPGHVDIRWFRWTPRQGPVPPVYHPPDWHNTQRYQRLGFGK